MHQVWEIEKVIEAIPVLDAQHTSFVIPKIIVETQVELAEAKATTTTAFSPEDIITASNSIVVDRDTPEKLLNQKMEKHSSDNGDSAATANDNISPVMVVESSIYHYGKQQKRVDDEQQHMSVEHELQKINDIKITGDDGEKMKGITMTHEAEIKSNNFDGADKINDEQQQPHTFNDKISEIYRKIEKIEGEYYDEKEKIIENFEKRMSSPTPDAVAASAVEGNVEEISSMEPDEFANADTQGDEVVQSEIKPTELHENWNEAQVDGNQFNYDYQPELSKVEENEDDNKQTLQDVEHIEAAGPQPMFDINQYASTSSKDHHQDDNVVIDGGELQANLVEYPSSSSEMQYQQDYYGNDATGFEGYTQYEQDQQQYQTPYEAPTQEQLDSNYQQNSNYDITENVSNYNETSAVYYDPNLAADTHQIIYDDQNYSNQQPMMAYQSNEGDSAQMSEYIYEQPQEQQNQEQFYDNNNALTYLQDHSDENNYYGNNEQGGEVIETSNELNATAPATDAYMGNSLKPSKILNFFKHFHRR